MTDPAVQARIDRSRRILETAPDNHLARFGLAGALADAGSLDDAEREFRLCLQRQPDWMAAAIGLGRCLVGLARREEALQVLAAARTMALQQGHSAPLEEIGELEARCR